MFIFERYFESHYHGILNANILTGYVAMSTTSYLYVSEHGANALEKGMKPPVCNQLWLNRADWILYSCLDNQSRRRKTLNWNQHKMTEGLCKYIFVYGIMKIVSGTGQSRVQPEDSQTQAESFDPRTVGNIQLHKWQSKNWDLCIYVALVI